MGLELDSREEKDGGMAHYNINYSATEDTIR